MQQHDAQVIVAGGGPVGMGLAIDLAQRGIDVLVLERHPEPQPVPKGQNLTQRTMEHFIAWGAEEALRAARTIPPEVGIGGITAYRTLFGSYHYDWLQRELVRPFYYTDNERLPQYATERVLRARAAQVPGVKALTGWTVTGLTQNDASVTVSAERKEDGTARNWTARYLVGCDGSRSIVRDAAGIGQRRNDHDRLMALLVFRSVEFDRLLARFPGKSYYNVLHPDLGGYWQFFGRVDMDSTFFFHAPVPDQAQRDDFDFAGYLQAAAGAAFDVDLRYRGFWDLRFAIADRYRADNVFIAGDAAHSHPPYGGYGINTGFEDARNLGWKLAAILQGWGGPALLDSYDAERRPIFESTARDFIARSIEDDRRFLEGFDPERNKAAFEAEWRSRAEGARTEVGAYAPHYAGSPIIPASTGTPGAIGEHSLDIVAGRHMPPLPDRPSADMPALLGQTFALLDFGLSEKVRQAIMQEGAALGVPLVRTPCPSESARVRGALIRPDHFVAWAGDDADWRPGLLGATAGHL
ncbi:MAG: monooxygenase [Sphingobium sp. SCN 64-10]|nr:MAG: monooxygenase [Sphingobium sp. SCN 64-10]